MAAPLDAVPTTAASPSGGRARSSGGRQRRLVSEATVADLRLFAMTYAVGFLFVSIILG